LGKSAGRQEPILALQWTYQSSSPIFATPAVVAALGLVITAGADGRITALLASGKRQFTELDVLSQGSLVSGVVSMGNDRKKLGILILCTFLMRLLKFDSDAIIALLPFRAASETCLEGGVIGRNHDAIRPLRQCG
jgi:hypothetical protein